KREESAGEFAAGHDERGPREAEQQTGDLRRVEPLAQNSRREERRPDRDQADQPARVDRGRERQAVRLQHLVQKDAEKSHRGEGGPGFPGRDFQPAPDREQRQKEGGPERETRENERDRGDLRERGARGDERDSPQ